MTSVAEHAPTHFRGYRNIDRSGSAVQLLDYLDGFSSIGEVREAKRESLSLLELRPGAAALDVGCGTGDEVIALAELVGPGGSAVGVDPSAAAVAEARRRAAALPAASFEEAGVEQLPYPDGRFDACRCDRTLQHVADPEAALAELVRVTAPGGRVVVSEVMTSLLVDGEPDRSATAQTVLGEMWTERDRTSWVGYMLPLLFPRAGLTDCGAKSETRKISHLNDIERVLPIRDLAASAVRGDRLAEQDAEAWLAQLDAAAGRAALEVRMTFLHVYGSKPSD